MSALWIGLIFVVVLFGMYRAWGKLLGTAAQDREQQALALSGIASTIINKMQQDSTKAGELQDLIDRRFGESFTLLETRLDSMHRGLGEMQALAGGVGELKRILGNVKIRGTWAEVQLGALLEQTLAPQQYQKNVKTRPDSKDLVEYVLRLPGVDQEVWIPIDSKFPQEDYLRIQTAADQNDPAAVQKACDALANSVRKAALDISKYINPPQTTDFAVMFLATEGLYTEVVRYPGLLEDIQKRRVMVAGPTTITAFLSSLRLGFQSLAVQQRASEVWEVLATVKTEFTKLGEVVEKIKRPLGAASTAVDELGTRTRAMERALRAVEE